MPRLSPTAKPFRSTPLFEGLLGLLAALRVARSGLPVRQVERPQQSQHPGLAVADAPALLHPPAQIDNAPSRDFVDRRIGTGQHDRFQCRHLPVAQLWPASRRGPIAQSGNSARVVAVNPVTQGLAVHPGQPRGARAIHALQRVGDRDQPGADATIARPPRPPAQLLRTNVLAYARSPTFPFALSSLSLWGREEKPWTLPSGSWASASGGTHRPSPKTRSIGTCSQS